MLNWNEQIFEFASSNNFPPRFVGEEIIQNYGDKIDELASSEIMISGTRNFASFLKLEIVHSDVKKISNKFDGF